MIIFLIWYSVIRLIKVMEKDYILKHKFFIYFNFSWQIKKIHVDVQYKNFFYKEIKVNENDDEYFHYKVYDKDIYVKNVGFLIVLGDYGLSKEIENTEKELLIDYFQFLEYYHFDKSVKNEKDYFFYLLKSESMFKIKLEDGEKELNKNPYYIFSNKNNEGNNLGKKREGTFIIKKENKKGKINGEKQTIR